MEYPARLTRTEILLLPLATAALLLCAQGVAQDRAPAVLPTPAAPVAAPATVGQPVTVAADPAAAQSMSAVDANAEFRRLFDARQYLAAIPVAQRVVTLAEQESGGSGESLEVGLMNLGTTQSLAEDYVGAEASFLRVISLMEASGKPKLERLARANAALATAYHSAKRHDLAVQRFEQAAGLNRRAEGLLNEGQLPLLEKYADSLTELGRYEDALKVERYALRIATRNYPPNDPRLAPPLENIARWYSRVGLYEPAKSALRQAIDAVEAGEGPNSVKLISPLMTLAETTRRQLLDPTQSAYAVPENSRSSMYVDSQDITAFAPLASAAEGQHALDRANAIVDATPTLSPATVADVRTQTGDWLQCRGQHQRALPFYQQAWQAGRKVAVRGQPLNELLFKKPVLLHYLRPDAAARYGNRPPDQLDMRTVELALLVSPEGRVKSGRVVEDGGDPERGQRTLRAAMETARYRPRLVEGQPTAAPIATEDVRLVQVWQVLRADAPMAEPGKSAAASGATAAPPAPTAPPAQPVPPQR
jgi:tetratricopeptide (TPR) repeat protein